MIENYGSRIEEQRDAWKKGKMREIEKSLESGSSGSNSGSEKIENKASNNPIDEINKSDNPLDATLKMIDEGKDVSYIMKSLKRIDFNLNNNSDFEYRRIKNSEAKKQIAEKVFGIDGGWKIVLDNWESLNDLTDDDKESLVNTFKQMIENADPDGKEVYYDYLDKKVVTIGTKDDTAGRLFRDVLWQREVDLNNWLGEKMANNPEKTSNEYIFGGGRGSGENDVGGNSDGGNPEGGDGSEGSNDDSEGGNDDLDGGDDDLDGGDDDLDGGDDDLDGGNDDSDGGNDDSDGGNDDSDGGDDDSEGGDDDLDGGNDDLDGGDDDLDGGNDDSDGGNDDSEGDDDELHGYDPSLNIAGNVDPNHFIDEDQIPKSLHKYIDN